MPSVQNSSSRSYAPPHVQGGGRRPGGRRVYGAIGVEAGSLDELIGLLKEKGLPLSAFDRLQERLGVSAGELAAVVQIADRTLRRRRKEGRLRTDESERVLRIARLFDRAADVLGTPERARKWMRMSLPALGGKTPLEYADTEPGAREVENVLGRIAYGVFS